MEYKSVHIICHYDVFQHIMIGLCMSFGSYILSGVVARILVHPALKIRQQTALYSDSIPRAIITLIRINTYYYVLLRIFLRKCCFMMSFVVFTHYYVLMLVSTYYIPPKNMSQGSAWKHVFREV